MEYTGYLDFWFTDRPLRERIVLFAVLGIKQFNVFFWRQAPIAELAAEYRQHGGQLYSTFDDNMGSLADPGDNDREFYPSTTEAEAMTRTRVIFPLD